MKTFVCISRKGGVGKTTVAFNIAMGIPYVLSSADVTGKSRPRVLVIDLDPQRDLTKSFLGDEVVNAGEIDRNVYDFLTCDNDAATLMACVHRMRLCDVIPGSTLKNDVLNLLASKPLLLRERLAVIGKMYDACIIDLPPARDAVSIGALLASDYAIPCTDMEPRGADGVMDTMTDIKGIKKEFNIDVMVPFIAVKSEPAELYSDADVEWLKKRLAKYTTASPWLIQYDSKLIRDSMISNQLIYYFARKKLTRIFAHICVTLVVYYLGGDLRDPGYAPFTYYYDVTKTAYEKAKRKIRLKRGDR